MYPSPVSWTAGIFVHEQARALVELGHDVRVVSPKAWAPPLLPKWKSFRDVSGVDTVDGIPVLYPRKLTLPGARLGHRNSDAMSFAISGPLRRIRRRWQFDVIHAHMVVPDGWAAARIGAELGVPVVATAHRADVLDVPAQGARSRERVVEADRGHRLDLLGEPRDRRRRGGPRDAAPADPDRPQRRRHADLRRALPGRGARPSRTFPPRARSSASWASWCPVRVWTR